jgi:broad specificity phosphatase PhoE
MGRVFYLSHPQVEIDPAVPVPAWGLSALGRDRAMLATVKPWTSGVKTIVSSQERKAVETALVIAAARGVAASSDEGMHENDRSATGYLAPPDFERTADAFFAQPDESVTGWERAVDAQARIVAACGAVLAGPLTEGDVLFVGHGGVGTLLLCHLLGAPISRRHDQPAGGGNVFAFDAATRRVLHPWLPLEHPGVGLARAQGLG